jgi:uncharacterized surface protein with fasciclin (FAS1) repeats
MFFLTTRRVGRSLFERFGRFYFNTNKDQIMKITHTSVALLLLLGGACAANDSTAPVRETTPASRSASTGEQDIVAVARSAGSFSTLIAAVEAAGLTEALQGDGPFTVFAPTDEAFAALPPGTVDALLQDKEQLARILSYHVVSGRVTASEVAGIDSAPTLEGRSLSIDSSSGVRINDAQVVTADVMASNGVIHVIDKVLIPGS